MRQTDSHLQRHCLRFRNVLNHAPTFPLHYFVCNLELAIRTPHFILPLLRNIFTENRAFFFGFPKAAVLHRKTVAFTLQNLRFCNAKQQVLERQSVVVDNQWITHSKLKQYL